MSKKSMKKLKRFKKNISKFIKNHWKFILVEAIKLISKSVN